MQKKLFSDSVLVFGNFLDASRVGMSYDDFSDVLYNFGCLFGENEEKNCSGKISRILNKENLFKRFSEEAKRVIKSKESNLNWM